MSNLSEQQFAKYSALEVPARPGRVDDDYDYRSLPASMERHAPGEYQPTLPGMENMLKGEQTHVSVLFKNKAEADDDNWSGVKGSDWRPREKPGGHVSVDPRTLAPYPLQEWVSDNALHEPRTRSASVPRNAPHAPLLENIKGQRVIQDGNHRVARAILSGAPKINAKEWKA